MKLKTFYTTLLFFAMSSAAIASVDSIENDLTKCLKNRYLSYDMICCTEKASDSCIAELSKFAQNSTEAKINQTYWNNYKQSTSVAIISHLKEAHGTMYHECASSTTYEINKNRLIILNYLYNNADYKREKYLSDDLKNCLNHGDASKCYITTANKYKSEINDMLNDLKANLSQKDYQSLMKNQSDWNKYYQNTTTLSSKLGELKKSQITKLLLEERKSQLYMIQVYAEYIKS